MSQPRSTAKFISYDLRPAKQLERKIIADILSFNFLEGFNIQKYRYVGLGANRFYDHILFFKHLGIKKLVSLEYDSVMYQRAKLNKSLDYIKLHNKSTTEYLSSDTYRGNSIYWFDYDSTLTVDVIDDIRILGSKAKVNDFVFVTVCGEMATKIQEKKVAEKRVNLEDQFGDLAYGIPDVNLSPVNYYKAFDQILVAALKESFNPRADGDIFVFTRISYKDSLRMITVGGVFTNNVVKFKSKINTLVPFMDENSIFKIPNFELTELEKRLFDIASSNKKVRCRGKKTLESIGFTENDVRKYRAIARYIPRYIETAI